MERKWKGKRDEMEQRQRENNVVRKITQMESIFYTQDIS